MNDQLNFLNSNKYKNSNDNSSLNNNFFININENRTTNELKEIRNSYENDDDNYINKKNSEEIIIKSLQEIIDELNEYLYNDEENVAWTIKKLSQNYGNYVMY